MYGGVYTPVPKRADVLVGATHAVAVGDPAERGSPLKQRIRPVPEDGLPVQILANRLECMGAMKEVELEYDQALEYAMPKPSEMTPLRTRAIAFLEARPHSAEAELYSGTRILSRRGNCESAPRRRQPSVAACANSTQPKVIGRLVDPDLGAVRRAWIQELDRRTWAGTRPDEPTQNESLIGARSFPDRLQSHVGSRVLTGCSPRIAPFRSRYDAQLAPELGNHQVFLANYSHAENN